MHFSNSLLMLVLHKDFLAMTGGAQYEPVCEKRMNYQNSQG